MGQQFINLQVAEVAFSRATGSAFEKFVNSFLPNLLGVEFVPLGGVHDGGADAFDELFEGKKAGSFYQATVEEKHRAKIRRTVQRLREFGRSPRRLFYITTQTIKAIDVEEMVLGEELDVAITIRDLGWIIGNISQNSGTQNAYFTYIGPFISDLPQPGSANIVSLISSKDLKTAVVFLSQEVESRKGKTELMEAITDSLIIWSLRDTDPDKNTFMSRDKILEAIEETLPSTKAFIRGVINNRLKVLSKKSSGREIKFHSSIGGYCLPFETRQIIRDENAQDEILKRNVQKTFLERAQSYVESKNLSVKPTDAANAALSGIEKSFEREGTIFSDFLRDADKADYGTLNDSIADSVRKLNLIGNEETETFETAVYAARMSFYNSTDDERLLYNKWFRTYSLLFSLQAEPRIVEWFRNISGKFYLYVGADIIIKALSERFIGKESQMACNMLEILSASGSTLVLPEPVLEEVYSNIKAADLEFQNYYADAERHITMPMAQSCSRILIRTYLYSKLRPVAEIDPPKSWREYINLICAPNKLHRAEGKSLVRMYLTERFNFDFESHEDMEARLDMRRVQELASKMNFKEPVLAINDSKMVFSVYAKRLEMKEMHRPNPFGYRVWWLTHESKILSTTRDIVSSYGSRYMMRPEFILNYISLSPKMANIRETYGSIFPTLLGISLGSQVKDKVMESLLDKLSNVKGFDDARLKVEAARLSNLLMANQFKKYHFNMEGTDKNDEEE